MNKLPWYWLNDEWVHLDALPEPDLLTAGGFESILFTENRLPLFIAHYERLSQGLSKDFGLALLPPPAYLQEIIHQLIQKNNIHGSAKVRVRVFKYALDEAWNLLLEAIPLSEDAYSWDEKGWEVGTFEVDRSQLHSSYKQIERSVYQAASIFAKSKHWQDVLLIDNSKYLIETSIGNIFYFKSGHWYTCPLDESGIKGIMRSILIDILGAIEAPLCAEELGQVEDLFICNAIRGIRWVRTCEGLKWTGSHSKKAFQQLIAWKQKNSK